MKLRRLLIVGTVGLLGVVGCSSGRDAADSGGAAAVGSSPSAATQCDGADLQATDVGITKDKITIETIADVGSQFVPGMANGSLEAVKAWAKLINQRGGLACRQVEVRTFDSKLDPNEARNGMVDACQNAFSEVGSFMLAVADVTPLAECDDAKGRRTGQPDVPALASNALVACNKTTYLATGSSYSCPAGRGERTFTVSTAMGDYIRDELGGDAKGQFQIGYTSPTLLDTSLPQIVELRDQGLTGPVHGAKGSDPQAAYTPVVQGSKDRGDQFVFSNSTFPSFLLLQKEAKAQGVSVPHWYCQSTCYDPAYPKVGGDLAKGVEIFINSLPYEEANVNAEMKTFVDNVETHNTFSITSWLAARLFQTAVESVVKTAGPNGLTRASLLTALAGVKDFDAGGLTGPVTPADRQPSPCAVVVKVNDGGTFERVFPKEPGKLSCGRTEKRAFDPVAVFSG